MQTPRASYTMRNNQYKLLLIRTSWNMANKRKKATHNKVLLLFCEVGGVCPRCQRGLVYEKKDRTHRSFEIAHIYPLNPRPDEAALLAGEERLSTDVNSLDNLILMCERCHTRFDKPRTTEEYQEIVRLKKKLISQADAKQEWGTNHLETEIANVIEAICNADIKDEDIDLSYDPKKVDEKVDPSLTKVTLRRIKNNVNDYFPIVRKRLFDQDMMSSGVADIISSQVNLFYLKRRKAEDSQQRIYEDIVEWLHVKSGQISEDACDVIASFFVQNCEIFG